MVPGSIVSNYASRAYNTLRSNYACAATTPHKQLRLKSIKHSIVSTTPQEHTTLCAATTPQERSNYACAATTPHKQLRLKSIKHSAQSAKRDLCIPQKRPMYTAKETYVYCKRDLFILQKRRMYTVKETYANRKRDLCRHYASRA